MKAKAIIFFFLGLNIVLVFYYKKMQFDTTRAEVAIQNHLHNKINNRLMEINNYSDIRPSNQIYFSLLISLDSISNIIVSDVPFAYQKTKNLDNIIENRVQKAFSESESQIDILNIGLTLNNNVDLTSNQYKIHLLKKLDKTTSILENYLYTNIGLYILRNQFYIFPDENRLSWFSKDYLNETAKIIYNKHQEYLFNQYQIILPKNVQPKDIEFYVMPENKHTFVSAKIEVFE